MNEYELEGGQLCCCGCKEPATQIYKGVNLPSKNPMTHYRKWKFIERIQRRTRSQMDLGSLALRDEADETEELIKRIIDRDAIE